MFQFHPQQAVNERQLSSTCVELHAVSTKTSLRCETVNIQAEVHNYKNTVDFAIWHEHIPAIMTNEKRYSPHHLSAMLEIKHVAPIIFSIVFFSYLSLGGSYQLTGISHQKLILGKLTGGKNAFSCTKLITRKTNLVNSFIRPSKCKTHNVHCI